MIHKICQQHNVTLKYFVSTNDHTFIHHYDQCTYVYLTTTTRYIRNLRYSRVFRVYFLLVSFFFFFNVLVISTYIRHLVCKYLLIYLPEIEMLIFVSHMKYKYYILWLINLKILNCRHRRIIYYLYCCMYCTVYTQEMFKTVLNHYLLSGT